ncbi:hypothetical protein F7725_012798 [Dissostichus mawsoni]|uniref:Nuclear receptor corepressor 2 n=1 Tax=Dissostichus mawsoni TaxID=36200 RepID=A0A7J5YND2_DISMA|nr:hypothetical protein F7725_012798 [Dissostichus mawsoni]
MVPTVKEAGRSIHLIPREPGKEGIIAQGTPMKQEPSGSGKRHDVRSIIASSPRSYHNPASHLEMRAERGRYEEAPKGRPSAVVSTASSIARSSPLTLGSEQGGKSHHSPGGYEDKAALRAPYPGPSHRGSPLSREASQRQHDGSSKNPTQERKSTPTPREMNATKSPLQGVQDQQTYERLLQGLGAADVYRQIPIAFDPASLPRGIPIDPAAYYLPRHLAPNPAYPHPYPYLIRGFPDTTALENRQTLLNDYITSQQMHQWPAAAAMAAQRSDLLRGLTPRDQPLQMPYSQAPRGAAGGPMDRITYIPGGAASFPGRPYTTSPISPVGSVHMNKMQGASSERERDRERDREREREGNATEREIGKESGRETERGKGTGREKGTETGTGTERRAGQRAAEADVLHNTGGKSLSVSDHSGSSVFRSMSSGSARYQGYPGHLQRTGVPPEAYQPAMDSGVAKEQSRDGGKNRGGLPKHMQDQHGPSSKSDPKLSSPGGMYPGSYSSPSGRPQHLLPHQSDNPLAAEKVVHLVGKRLKTKRCPFRNKSSEHSNMETHGLYRPPSEERLSPGQQPSSPSVKGSQRVVTLAQHISCLPAPPTSQESAQGSRYQEAHCGERNRDRSPPQPKTSPISVCNDGIEPVSPAGASSEPEVQGGASYSSEQGEQGMGSRSPPNTSQPPAFFSKLTESTSDIVRSKKQEMIKKMTVVGNDGPVAPRPHPASEQPGNSIGLEAIIRKALMGKYDDQPEERSPSNLMGSGGVPAADGRGEDFFSQGGGKSSKGSGRSNGRKAKSPGPGLSGGERPSSVSSVHSEGDCNRRTPLTNRVWEDRPSSTGSTPTPFPCNPLIMRFPSGTVSAPSPASGQLGGPVPGPGQGRSWEEEPKPLLMSQYETLSDSEEVKKPSFYNPWSMAVSASAGLLRSCLGAVVTV